MFAGIIVIFLIIIFLLFIIFQQYNGLDNNISEKKLGKKTNNTIVSFVDTDAKINNNECYQASESNTHKINLYSDKLNIIANKHNTINFNQCQIYNEGIISIPDDNIFVIQNSGLYNITYKINSLCKKCIPIITINHSPIELKTSDIFDDSNIFMHQLCLTQGDQLSFGIKNNNNFNYELKQTSIDVIPSL